MKRSILKQLQTKREEVLIGAGVGEDCAILTLAEDEVFVVSTDPITGTSKDAGMVAVHITANDLASSGAEPIALYLHCCRKRLKSWKSGSSWRRWKRSVQSCTYRLQVDIRK